MTDTKSMKMIQDQWPAFAERVRTRLLAGAQTYGDRSFELPAGTVLAEVEDELLDVMGWSFIAWQRIQRLRTTLEKLEPPL